VAQFDGLAAADMTKKQDISLCRRKKSAIFQIYAKLARKPIECLLTAACFLGIYIAFII